MAEAAPWSGPGGGYGGPGEVDGGPGGHGGGRRLSFRSRLSLLVAVAVGVAVALAALASYFLVKQQLYAQTDSDLKAQVEDAIVTNPDGTTGLDLRSLTRTGHSGAVVQLVNSAGQVVLSIDPSYNQGAATANRVMPVPPAVRALAQPQSAGQVTFLSGRVSTGRVRILARGLGPVILRVPGQEAGFSSMVLEVAYPLYVVDHTLADLRIILLLVALVGIAVALGLGYAVARATIRPVERLTAAAEHVAATQDLGATIDDTGDDELGRLARTFNAMLAALAASRAQQSQLVADAGHELRTPLTSLRTNIEVLMRARQLPEADRDQLLSDVKAQLEELTTLVGDLVELAREDERDVEPVDMRFDEVVDRAVQRAQRRASGLEFDVSTDPGMVKAQPALLERAVLNVLDNAVKWSPPGATVRVTLRRADAWSLDVRDQGPGVSPEDLPRVFDRFYRADSARAMPGSGLGLAIVRQVVEAGGGQVAISCPPGGGTLVHIEMPIVTEDSPLSWADVPVPTAPGGTAAGGGPPGAFDERDDRAAAGAERGPGGGLTPP